MAPESKTTHQSSNGLLKPSTSHISQSTETDDDHSQFAVEIQLMAVSPKAALSPTAPSLPPPAIPTDLSQGSRRTRSTLNQLVPLMAHPTDATETLDSPESSTTAAQSPASLEVPDATSQAVIRKGKNGGKVIAPAAKIVTTNGRNNRSLAINANNSTTTDTMLYVCDGCFKYMLKQSAYLAHKVRLYSSCLMRALLISALVQRTCTYKRPPGRKVYQRGAHIIWEVDGLAEKVRISSRTASTPTDWDVKLWCQNLALFGKLFIDHKYVFFDVSLGKGSALSILTLFSQVEGFFFYVLTDGQPSQDHVMGFFSKVIAG